MSAAAEPSLDLREQLARIDRMIDEQQKLRAEQQKLMAERGKLEAERMKLDTDRRWTPWLVSFSAVTAGVTAGGLLLKAAGVLP